MSENGQGARILAGGTDLIPWMAEELVAPQVLVDIKRIRHLGGISQEKDELIVGALVTFSELIDSILVHQRIPLLWEMSKVVASPGIRNRATLVGNICSAVPSGDGGPVLLVCEARVRAMSAAGERSIAIADWFLGPKRCALRPGEIVTALSFPLSDERHGNCYLKLGRYRGEDLAQASVAVVVLSDHRCRVAFGAVSPTPLRSSRIEHLLNGRELTDELIARAQGLVSAEIDPITDIRATREYRLHMVRVMLERGLRAAQSRLLSRLPPYGTRLI